MMYYLGITIMVWLAVGFVVGIKSIYVDKCLSKENLEKLKKDLPKDEMTEEVFKHINKKNVLVAMSLLGFIAFYADTVKTFRKTKVDKGEK